MIKQLKTLRQIKKESNWKYSTPAGTSIDIYDGKIRVGNIIKEMYPFFGEEHEVLPTLSTKYYQYYQWKIESGDSYVDYWYYKDVWFEPELQLLEDDLFEI